MFDVKRLISVRDVMGSDWVLPFLTDIQAAFYLKE